MRVLVINSGSSSIKYRFYDMKLESVLLSGSLERIGEEISRSIYCTYHADGNMKEHQQNLHIPDHATGLQQIFTLLEINTMLDSATMLDAIGHRVVHGGETFKDPVFIDEKVIEGIRAMIPLAPLHNPANLAGIEAARRLYPQVPQVAVFDTAFFQTLPPRAFRYALPDALYQEHHVRRYGFHGTSHQSVSRQAANILEQPLTSLRLITLHLGNGASASAIQHGCCIDTSMGMTPLEGLIMGSRCGDLDPSVPFYIARTLGMAFDEIETLLNQESGMKGLCGVNDMREVHRLAQEGDGLANLAIEMYCYRICKYIGAYFTILGGLDALIFTGGIGENDPLIRQLVCERLSILDIILDGNKNQNSADTPLSISADESKIKVLVLPTNEELEIARQAASIVRHHADN